MSRVLLLAFDAASPALLEEGIRDGWLPHLRALRRRGGFGHLRSTSDWLAGSAWPSFSMGVPPNEHGCYHYIQWRADEMALKRPDADWMAREPFWREVAREGVRVLAIDVPYTPPPRTDSTVELSGWGTSEVIFPPYARPRRLANLVRETYGRLPRTVGEGMAFERYAPQPLPALMRVRDQLVDIAGRSAELASRLIATESWDLCIAVFGSAHRAGHLLWSSSSVEGDGGREVDDALRRALRDVYAACDRAIGRIVEEAERDDMAVLVFSLTGMSDNTSRNDLLPTMLARILAGGAQGKAAHERLHLAKKLRRAIPASLRHRVKSGLPLALQDKLTALWRVGAENWERTRAFSLTADAQGYVRINLRGREARGIVEPGAEYDGLCAEIADGLVSFRDRDTGEPVVERVARVDELFGPGAKRDSLPDLIVRWAPTACVHTHAIISPTLGSIDWPTPGKNPNGRSGNHTGEGFVLGMGRGIARGSDLGRDAHILDLPPTICRLLGREPLDHMSGSVIRSLLSDGEPRLETARP